MKTKSCPNRSLPSVKRFRKKRSPIWNTVRKCDSWPTNRLRCRRETLLWRGSYKLRKQGRQKFARRESSIPDTGMRSTDVEHNTAPRDTCSTSVTSASAVNGPPTSPVPTTYHSKHTVPIDPTCREPTAPPRCGTVAKTEFPTSDRCRPCLDPNKTMTKCL